MGLQEEEEEVVQEWEVDVVPEWARVVDREEVLHRLMEIDQLVLLLKLKATFLELEFLDREL